MRAERLIVAAIVFSAPPLAAAPGASACPITATETVGVVEVVDGDTLRTDAGDTLHLAGIEAAKAGQFAADWARAAADRTRGLMGGGTVGITATGFGADRYGRRHVHAFGADGSWIQGDLVAAGLARVRTFLVEDPCFPALLAAESRARSAGKGLWSDPKTAVRAADDSSLSGRNGLYEIIEGRVLSVGHGSSMIFLDFGRDYRRDFTVMVPKKLVDRFAEYGLILDDLVGERVRVRGVVEESGGPAIRVNHPAVIEVLDKRS
ncbi:thermonuclease family protein [Bauldia sp.]|uniref:thermonuclease family protein n=1 Tax=Bauldia sp. TaxID=2575872 RepID=UPI003BAB1023